MKLFTFPKFIFHLSSQLKTCIIPRCQKQHIPEMIYQTDDLLNQKKQLKYQIIEIWPFFLLLKCHFSALLQNPFLRPLPFAKNEFHGEQRQSLSWKPRQQNPEGETTASHTKVRARARNPCPAIPRGSSTRQSSLHWLWTELGEKWQLPYREKKNAVNKEHSHRTQRGWEIKSLAAPLSD